MFIREDVDFISNGVRCSAWLYLPTKKEKVPVIVMAHGLGCVREMRLDAYAEKFVTAGYACFLFDYRNFGASDGDKRQRIQVKEQLTDWEHAIDFVKKTDKFNAGEILLFGSSFSGGHVIALSSKRKDIHATIAQCPYTDFFATLRTVPFLTALKMFPLILADTVSSVSGYHPVMMKIGGAPGEAAMVAVPDYKEFLTLAPTYSNFVNEAPARTLLEILKYSPGKYTKDIKTPILYAVSLKDSIAPADATIKCAKRSPQAKITTYKCGHFGIYTGKFFEEAVTDYIDFFAKTFK